MFRGQPALPIADELDQLLERREPSPGNLAARQDPYSVARGPSMARLLSPSALVR